MDPITGTGDRFPALSANWPPAEQAGPPSSSPPPPPQYVYILPPTPPPSTDGGGWKWRLIRLVFVALVMGAGALLLALGHPAEAVVAVLLGSGLAAVEILKALKKLG